MVNKAGEGMAQTGRRRFWGWTGDREEDKQQSPGMLMKGGAMRNIAESCHGDKDGVDGAEVVER